LFLPFFLYRGKKEAKKGTFSDVLGGSRLASFDLGRCPKNPPTFEKVGSKLLYLQQSVFVLCTSLNIKKQLQYRRISDLTAAVLLYFILIQNQYCPYS